MPTKAKAPTRRVAAATRTASSKKLDLYARHRSEYTTPRTPAFVDVGPAQYLAIDGAGAPESPAFAEAVGSLYGVAYTIKMARKRAGLDYKVAALEALWWTGDDVSFSPATRGDWQWRLMIRVPDFISQQELRDAIDALVHKGKSPAVDRIRLFGFREGRCVQVLHVGPYDQETPTIEALHAFAATNGVQPTGRHHEIYLSDPRRVAPDKLRTIIRQPVR